MLISQTIIFFISLVILVKSSDFFIRGAEEFSQVLGVNPFITGVIIVGFGTSLPELVSGIIAAIENTPSIISGNAVGSNIANLLLVLGIAAVFAGRINVEHDMLKNDLPAILTSSLILFFSAMDGMIELKETIIFLLFLIAYFVTLARERNINDKQKDQRKIKHIKLTTVLFLLLPPIGIFLGAKYTVSSVVSLATLLNINPGIIALSAVSIGTSLPEIVVTIQACKKGQGELAIGNVTGSNIFNIFGVMGISGVFGSYSIPEEIVSFSIPFLLGSTILYLIMILDKRILFLEGVFLLLMYAYFLMRIFGLIN